MQGRRGKRKGTVVKPKKKKEGKRGEERQEEDGCRGWREIRKAGVKGEG